ncbi:hypothetical protein QYF36_021789 [Acer negundo]|nr:hypothetical protein QYF36_021789 [Acer negundo]
MATGLGLYGFGMFHSEDKLLIGNKTGGVVFGPLFIVLRFVLPLKILSPSLLLLMGCLRLVLIVMHGKKGRLGWKIILVSTGRLGVFGLTVWIGGVFMVVSLNLFGSGNRKAFMDGLTVSSLALDSIKLQIMWKHHGCGSSIPLTSLIQCVSEFCVDFMTSKKREFEEWIPPGAEVLKFNVDGSAKG